MTTPEADMTTPEAAFVPRDDQRSPGPFAVLLGPLKGAASAAWPSQLRDARLFGAAKFGPETPSS